MSKSPQIMFADAIDSIDKNGAYAIATISGMRIKKIMAKLKYDCNAASLCGDNSLQNNLVDNAMRDVMAEMAHLMGSMHNMDSAYSDFLREIQVAISSVKRVDRR